MLTFIAKRLVQSVLVMLTVALIAFSLFRYVGDPINNMVAAPRNRRASAFPTGSQSAPVRLLPAPN
jgi:ABC-type dipeptide/oligopeptide/nickel transport system permease component